VKLVTNATSRSHRQLFHWLQEAGLLADPADLITPATVARRVLTARRQVSGHLIADAAAREDFAWFTEDPEGGVVLLASEGHDLRIADLQPAVRALLAGATLYTLQQNRYFRQGSELVTDLGPLAAFLAYAADRPVHNLGKPSPLLFDALAREAGVKRHEMVMVGDDAEFDAAGAVALGLAGILVRTGKYRPGDEARVAPPPTAILDSVADLPAWLERGEDRC
jgi:HAD superfamily hydrolase (TIGR01458 family)